MAINLEKRTQATMTLRLVSAHDSAIDWANSYQGVSITTEEGETLEDAKKRTYREDYDTGRLAWAPGDTPTIFAFRHPRIAEVREQIQGKMMALHGIGGKGGDAGRMAREVWNATFLGTAQGIGGEVVEVIKQKGRLSEDYVQMLLDAGVFDELSGAVLSEMNASNISGERQKKS